MKKRIISAVFLLLIFIPLLIEGNVLFKFGMVVLGSLCLRESLNIKYKTKFFLVNLFSYFLLTLLILNNSIFEISNFIIDYKLLSLIFLIFGILYLYYKNLKLNDIIYPIFFILLIGISFNLLILFRSFSITYFIYLFLITITTDTYAYMSGTLIGKHKLLKKVSPKKSVEGFIIGSVFGTLIASTYYHIFINDSISIMLVLSITLVLSLIGQFGDLFFSKIKREFNKKDFSNIMPGHGGVLDRFDSIIFVAIAFLLFVSYL